VACPNHLKVQMKYLLALVMLFASPAWAGWTFVADTSETPPSRHFFDFETLRKEGNEITIWKLVNFPPNHQNGWGSLRSKNLYDCRNETIQILSLQTFSEQFARGKESSIVNSPTTKAHIPPDTQGWTMLKEVCKR
jgi:hypothetical protein